MAGLRYRRSAALVLHWSDDTLLCFDMRRSRRLRVTPEIVACLGGMTEWTTPDALRARLPQLGSSADVRRLLTRMSRLGLLEPEGGQDDWPWAAWSPEAAFFHFGTRGGTYPDDPRAYDRTL